MINAGLTVAVVKEGNGVLGVVDRLSLNLRDGATGIGIDRNAQLGLLVVVPVPLTTRREDRSISSERIIQAFLYCRDIFAALILFWLPLIYTTAQFYWIGRMKHHRRC
jgi:hypothetical protein